MHAAWLLSPHVQKGKRVTAADLLGERKQTSTPMPGIFDTKESIVEAIKAARERRKREEDGE